eukprot:8894451-Pyramimonas_sp.AAC.2
MSHYGAWVCYRSDIYDSERKALSKEQSEIATAPLGRGWGACSGLIAPWTPYHAHAQQPLALTTPFAPHNAQTQQPLLTLRAPCTPYHARTATPNPNSPLHTLQRPNTATPNPNNPLRTSLRQDTTTTTNPKSGATLPNAWVRETDLLAECKHLTKNGAKWNEGGG